MQAFAGEGAGDKHQPSIAGYGIGGNFRALQRVHRVVERYWQKMLSSRSRKRHITWEVFHRIKEGYPLQRLPYRGLQVIAVL
jgi:RNA-directed DNA polymerase